MICPRCDGKGLIKKQEIDLGHGTWITRAWLTRPEPCPECHGSGIVSCCDAAGAGICEGGKPKDDAP